MQKAELSTIGRMAYQIKRDQLQMQSGTALAIQEFFGELGKEKSRTVTKQEQGIRYRDLITNFKAGIIWKEGSLIRPSFRRGHARYIWQMLLENKGKALSLKQLNASLKKEFGYDTASSYVAEKAYHNLVEKLAKVMNVDRKEIRKWFINSEGNITLKN